MLGTCLVLGVILAERGFSQRPGVSLCLARSLVVGAANVSCMRNVVTVLQTSVGQLQDLVTAGRDSRHNTATNQMPTLLRMAVTLPKSSSPAEERVASFQS